MPLLKLNILRLNISSFHLWGVIGFIAGITLGVYLSLEEGLFLHILGLLSLLGAGTFFVHAYLHKAITGEEDLVYYRHEVAILAVCASALWLLGQPVVAYLDITLMGIGAFLAFGRWGCYHVGCCHGRPCKVGVIYSEEHARAGFPYYYVGVKIFPIPLVESFFVFITVVVGCWFILQGYPPGTALIWYTVFYGGVRFVLEFYRGDPERPYWKEFSEAQWTTLLLFLLTVIFSYVGWLPFYLWHSLAVIGLILSMVAIAIYRKNMAIPFHKINYPQHVWEIASVLKNLERLTNNDISAQSPPIPIAGTSLGLNISMGRVHSEQGHIIHYSLSETNPSTRSKHIKLDRLTAESIGQLIQTIRHRQKTFEIREGQSNVFHILFNKP